MYKQHEINDELYLPPGFSPLCDLYKAGSRDYDVARLGIGSGQIHSVNLIKDGKTKGRIYIQEEETKSFVDNYRTEPQPEADHGAIGERVLVLEEHIRALESSLSAARSERIKQGSSIDSLSKKLEDQQKLVEHIASCLMKVMQRNRIDPDQLLLTLAKNHDGQLHVVSAS